MEQNQTGQNRTLDTSISNEQQATAYIHSYPRSKSYAGGLDDIRRLLERQGNPQDALRFLHVAGTNGKGSTVTMCASVLREAGYCVGTFMSPYIVSFRERFQVNGREAPDDIFVSAAATVRREAEALREEGIEFVQFEIVTAVGFEIFRRMACDIVCLEVGLGGRLDATNVICAPEVAVITSISLDHTELLGNTLAEIAAEKAGIVKPGVPVVCYPGMAPDALCAVMERALKTGSRVILPSRMAVGDVCCSLSGNSFTYGGEQYETRLVGEHQVYNAVMVLEVIGQLREKGWRIPQESVRKGLYSAFIPARFEVMRISPLVIIDGAHNQNGVEGLLGALGRLRGGRKLYALIGVLADKHMEEALAHVAQLFDRITCTDVTNGRTLSGQVLAQQLSVEGAAHVSVTGEAPQAMLSLIEQMDPDKDGLVVFGSLFLAAECRKAFLDAFRSPSSERRALPEGK